MKARLISGEYSVSGGESYSVVITEGEYIAFLGWSHLLKDVMKASAPAGAGIIKFACRRQLSKRE